ncbi:MAG: hypothetical protein IKF07_08815 [Eubacterium sp.]|nr:hypothetical protein [Eubacterium sp.]
MYCDINSIIKKELEDIDHILGEMKADKLNSSAMSENGPNMISLYAHNTSGKITYYKRFENEGERCSVKLGNSDNEGVIRIKQEKFNKEMIRTLNIDRKLLLKSAERYLPYDPESIDKRLKPVYRDDTGLVNKLPGIASMDEWKKIDKRNRYRLPDDCNTTTDGVKTRSKSEVIVYGILKGYGLIVKVDMEITLKNDFGQNVVVVPDFIILCNDGSLIIIEHLGMLDKADYLESVIRKIHLYQINGYRINDNLFLTADYAQGKIDAQVIDELVRKMILPRVKGTV